MTNEVETFVAKAFEIIVNEENPRIFIEYLKSKKNQRRLLFLAQTTTDKIDMAVYKCHINYITNENSTPYESISPNTFDQIKKIVESENLEIGTDAALHILYRIQYHFVEYQSTFSMLKQYIDIQIGAQISQKSEEIVDKASKQIKVEQERVELSVKKTTDEELDKITKQSKHHLKKTIKKIEQKEEEATEELSRKTAETSVSILGIFAAIVLTVVGSMLYSTSMLESVYNTDVCKLMVVASLVGIVCVDLLAVMFNFIGNIRISCAANKDGDKHAPPNVRASGNKSAKGKEKATTKIINFIQKAFENHSLVISINLILIIVMVVFSAIYLNK